MSIIQLALIFLSFWIIGALQIVVSYDGLWWLALLGFVPMGLIAYHIAWKQLTPKAVLTGLLSSLVASQLLMWYF
jgi:hypothetical protein